MNRYHQRVVLAAAIAGAAGLVLACRQPNEPHYQGRALSYYLSSQTYGDLRREREAREAIQALGSNALPWVRRILDKRESSLARCWHELCQRQSLFPYRSVPLWARQREAALACEVLGPVAAPAVPSLTRLAQDPDPMTQVFALGALAQIGPQSFSVLTNVLLCGSPVARLEAAGDLRCMRPPERAVPVLLQALSDPWSSVRSRAAESLGYLACQAELIVPALRQCLTDTDAEVRLSAACALGWVGPAAQIALPELARLRQREADSPAALRIAEAIQRIDPAAAERAGLP